MQIRDRATGSGADPIRLPQSEAAERARAEALREVSDRRSRAGLSSGRWHCITLLRVERLLREDSDSCEGSTWMR